MPNKKLLLIILFALLLSHGCWDVEEINRRTTVLGLGLENAPNGEYIFSAQIPIITNLRAGSISGATGDKLFYVIPVQAKTPFAAIPLMQSKTSEDLFLGQLKAFILSTTVAEQGTSKIIDFMERHPEIPPLVIMVLTEGSPQKFLSSPLNEKEIPAIKICHFFQSPGKTDRSFSMPLWEFAKTTQSGPGDAFLPLIYYQEAEKTFLLDGIGVFHRDRLVGKLSGVETRMFGFLSGRVSNTYPTVDIGKLGTATFRHVKVRSQTKVIVRKGRLEFQINIYAKGFLEELTSGKTDLSHQEIKAIEAATSASLKNELRKTVQHLQQLNSDILGLGELVRATHPGIWRRINWDKEYPKIPIRLKLDFNVEKMGEYR